MSESNGVLKVTTEGMAKLQLGDKGKLVEVDVIALLENWWAVDRSFRDESGKVLAERRLEHAAALVEFVRDIFREGGEDAELVARINSTQANHTMTLLAKRGKELQGFFVLATDVAPVSAGSTELRFSA